MKELLSEELAQSVEVSIAGKSYGLAFPIGAVILYKKLTGESLFKFSSWIKPGPDGGVTGAELLIGPQDDPEKFLFALYSGIYGGQLLSGYRGEPDPLLLSGLKASVDMSNAGDLLKGLIKALVNYIVPSSSSDAQTERPTTAERLN